MNRKVTVLVFSALACIHVANAGLGFGRCPKSVQAMKNFDVKKYVGHWYEFSSFDTVFEANGKCVQASYTLQNDGTISVVNSMVDKTSLKPQHIRGTAKLADNSGDAKLEVTLQIFAGIKGTSPLWILDTDYENYALAYSCVEIPFFHYAAGWALSRQTLLGDGLITKLETVITSNGLNPSQFKRQVQDCGVIGSDDGDCKGSNCKDGDRKNGDCKDDDCKDGDDDSDYSDCGCGYPRDD